MGFRWQDTHKNGGEDDMKRVAIVVHSLCGGGMERVASQLSVMLSDAGHDVYIIVGSFDKRKAYRHGGKIIMLPFKFGTSQNAAVRELQAFWLMLRNAWKLRQCKNKNKIDVTISFSSEMNMPNMLSGTGDRKILTVHSCLSARKDLKGLYYIRGIFRIYNLAYKVIAVSRWCRKDLIHNYGINRDNVSVIYNPVENSGMRCSVADKKNIVLAVGNLRDVKQQWHIIRAFKEVLGKVQDAELVIAGQGGNKEYLAKLARDMGIDGRVDFKGFVNEIDGLYREAKCVVFSSASEAFPCSVIEAMSHGVPVVAADCPGGIREMLAGNAGRKHRIEKAAAVEGGVLTPVLDGIKYDAWVPLTDAEHELAEGMAYLLENEEKRIEMAHRCLEISRQFSMEMIKEQWLELIEREK